MTFCFYCGWYHIGVNIYMKSNKCYYVHIAKVVNSKDVKGSNVVHGYELLPVFQIQVC